MVEVSKSSNYILNMSNSCILSTVANHNDVVIDLPCKFSLVAMLFCS